jgi:hypothetical protein
MNKVIVGAFSIISLFLLCVPGRAFASPYGAGVYDENVPYGGQTALTISTNGNVSVPITPSDSGTLNSATGTVTVVSSDVVGYKLYVRTLTSTDLTNGAATLPVSANSSPAALSTNTWGYNTTGSSTDFIGMTMSDVLIRSLTGPATSGDVTSVTYGVKVDNSKPAGTYQTTVIYTAVPETD